MCRFRCRNLKIPVVVHGHANRIIPYEERLCMKCNMNVIGDEYHYILQCPLFQPNRQKYLSNYYYINPNMRKFSSLMQIKNTNTLRKLARLITEISITFRLTS